MYEEYSYVRTYVSLSLMHIICMYSTVLFMCVSVYESVYLDMFLTDSRTYNA